jgi:pimeloyl-ACP methyl ester carboxylesterase
LNVHTLRRITTPDSHLWTRRAAIAAAAAGAATALIGKVRAADFPWQLPALRHTQVHGHQIAYYEAGSGAPLVLVHGGSGSPALELGRVFMPLSRKFRVIAPYMIGFGPSEQPDLPYDAATFVDYFGGFMRAVAAEKATLVGASLGGWVVGHYAVRQGGKTSWGQTLPPISHLVIVDGALQVHPGDGGGAQDTINNPEVGKLAHEFYMTLPKVDNSKVLGALGPHMLAEQVTDEQLKALHTPTLVMWGREDKLLHLENGRHFAALIPGAHLEIIDNCGHAPSMEQPQAYLAALDSFLANRAATA